MPHRRTVSQRRHFDTRHFGSRLKAARILHGFATADEFARALGIEAARYRMYERGEREAPYDLLSEMAARLEVSTDQLLGLTRPAAAARNLNDVAARLLHAGQRIRALPVRDERSADAIIGYDDDGLPR